MCAALISLLTSEGTISAPQGRASIQLQYVKVPRLPDVQNLLLWVLGEGQSPQWAFVRVRCWY